MTSTAETLHQCPHCEAEVDPEELGGRVYECQNDGPFVAEEGEGNRCPECNKFAAKIADQSCPDCGEAIEDGDLAEREVYRSEDGTTHDTAGEAETWDTPEAAAGRDAWRAAQQANTERIMADIRAESEARVARLRAALDLPTTPPIEYYRPALADPRGGVWIFDSSTASLTPDELRAVCGGAPDKTVERMLTEADDVAAGFWSESVSFGVHVEVLCTLLEALANRETS